MEKAFELKALGEKLKARGLDLAEESLKILVEETLDWVDESVKLTPTPMDDIASVIIPPLKATVLGLVDKVDGEVG